MFIGGINDKFQANRFVMSRFLLADFYYTKCSCRVMEKIVKQISSGVLTIIMFVNFCRHRLTIEADPAVSRAKAVASFLSYFMTLSIGSVLSPRPPLCRQAHY